MDHQVNEFFPYADRQRSLIETAALIAYTAHRTQTRKGDQSPYFIHPSMVALKLTAYQCTEEVVAAGYVHDVLEDTDFPEALLEAMLGSQVVQLVKTVSEQKALPWEERKQKYIDTVAQASEAVKCVSVADKIHNLQSLFSAHAKEGAEIWSVFNRGRDLKCWFEQTLCAELQKTWQHPMLDEYATLVAQLRTLD